MSSTAPFQLNPQEGEAEAYYGRSGSEQYASDEHSKSPLDRLGFAKFLSGEKKTRDGQPPKRRGPKPDSKPALTRRQELNRQAQRTHRERKEMYIKALEAEVMRLKEVYSDTTKARDTAVQEREAMAAEIRRLKDILAAHGIAHDSADAYASSTSGSQLGGSSYNPGSVSTGYTSPSQPSVPSTASPLSVTPLAQPPQQAIDLDRVGIDFVLALERPCMDHMQMLMVKSNDSEVEFSGHAMMASGPPESHIANHPDQPYPHKMPDMGTTDLLKLLDLSNRLPLDGEITPVMSWARILANPRRNELTEKDYEAIKIDLCAKVRCYGFGAVLEEFEVEDALASALASKDTMSADEFAMQFQSPAQMGGQAPSSITVAS